MKWLNTHTHEANFTFHEHTHTHRLYRLHAKVVRKMLFIALCDVIHILSPSRVLLFAHILCLML